MKRLLLALLVLGGCTEMQLAEAPGAEDLDHSIQSYLRLDVLPNDPAWLSQTFIDIPTEGEVDLVLHQPILVTGLVTAWALNPTAASELPGSSVPVADALVSIRRLDTLQSANDVTDDQEDADALQREVGSFALEIVPDFGYQVSAVPTDPLIPFRTEVRSLLEPTDLPIELGYGVAVWGSVLDASGSAVGGVSVYAVDSYGIAGAAALTAEDGTYQLRVDPGLYQIVAAGRGNGRDPTVKTSVEVGEHGSEVDFVYSDLQDRSVRGRVVDEAGEGVPNVTVQIRANALDGYPAGASFETSVVTNSSGNWYVDLLAGEYDIELHPNADLDISPSSLGAVTIGESFVDLREQVLEDQVPVQGLVLGPDGEPVAGALVSVTEIGFGGRSWQTSTDELGQFWVLASQVPVEYAVTPPAGLPAAIARTVGDPGLESAPVLTLETGNLLTGLVSYETEDGDIVPAVYAVVEARDDKGARWGVALTDGSGRFEMRVAAF